MKSSVFILGAGMTGLAAGYAGGLDVYEARPQPGGICSSYYVRPNDDARLTAPPPDGKAYRFEHGGGHWIFGGASPATDWISSLTTFRRYRRRSSVFFPESGLRVPYPLQNHLRYLPEATAASALTEITGRQGEVETLHEWLQANFGATLCRLFFWPFHRLYTAGLAKRIAPQDAFKSPIDLAQIRAGAKKDVPPAGYNATFAYPRHGLDELARNMAAACRVHYGKAAVSVSPARRTVEFADGTRRTYEKLISTLPLNRMMQLTGLEVESEPDPFTSVMVVNIGAEMGAKCPEEHWLYVPDSEAGFHRVGFYSNVDESFLPESSRGTGEKVAIYVEKAFPGGEKPSKIEQTRQAEAIVAELQRLNFIKTPEVVDPTWIDVAYTWSWPESPWRRQAIEKLREFGIEPMGRYGQWKFQGIAASIADGLRAGADMARFRVDGTAETKPSNA